MILSCARGIQNFNILGVTRTINDKYVCINRRLIDNQKLAF